MIKKNLILFFVFNFLSFFAQDFIPNQPQPPRFFNNFSKIYPDFISAPEANNLEKKLLQFNEETSNEIAVVVVDDFFGLEPWDFATKISNKWGIGKQNEDNGILILIKPTGSKSERKVFIAVGKGLEGAIPDITCNEIINNELLPNFKKNNFFVGIQSAVDVLSSLSKNEFNSQQYSKKNAKKSNSFLFIFTVLIFIFILFFFNKRNNGSATTIGSNGFFLGTGLGMMNGFGSNRSDSSGGFGGFGGGSFGGGGSGGSW